MTAQAPSRLFKLGKAPAKHDVRTLRLESYIGLFPPPPVVSSGKNKALMASCGMLGNDFHGDCVVADDGHDIELWTKLIGQALLIGDSQAVAFYQQASIALNHSAADQGLVMLDFLKWRMKTQWPAPINRPIIGFASFDHRNHTVVEQAIVAFGSARLGVALPITAQSQPAPGGTWSLVTRTGPGTPGSWGGHDVPAVDYDQGGVFVLTWGGVQYMTWDFFDYYVDEIYAVIPTDSIPGFDLAAFIADLKAIGAYIGPDVPPNPPPPSPPNPPPTPPADYVVSTAIVNTYKSGRKVSGSIGFSS